MQGPLLPPQETCCSVHEEPELGSPAAQSVFPLSTPTPLLFTFMTPTTLQRESDGSSPSLTLTSNNWTSEPCDDPRTNTVTSSLLGPGMFLIVCTRMSFVAVYVNARQL